MIRVDRVIFSLQGAFMLWQLSELLSFSWLNSIPQPSNEEDSACSTFEQGRHFWAHMEGIQRGKWEEVRRREGRRPHNQAASTLREAVAIQAMGALW